MSVETLHIVRKYTTPALTRIEEPPSRIPASTRIIDEIMLIEKIHPQLGHILTGALFEMIEWVRRDERKKLGARGDR